jgi:hypothetical protein
VDKIICNSKRINVLVQIRTYWWEKLPKINNCSALNKSVLGGQELNITPQLAKN